MEKTIDILCIGEIIIDLIGINKNKSISKTNKFSKSLGGSPVNVAVNVTNLGFKTAIVASIGKDEFGIFAEKKLKKNNINIQGLNKIESKNTTVIIVSKSDNTPQFIPYRSADSEIIKKQVDENLILESKIFHTTCFALSKNPAQKTILESAKFAFENGLKLSIDLNYSSKIWDDNSNYLNIIQEYLKYNPLVKVSIDDCERLFQKSLSDKEIFDYFHQNGVDLVCLTKGSEGVSLSNKYEITNKKAHFLPKIIDATGAGDAFWSGFLTAFLENKNWEKCIEKGQDIASLKLKTKGHIPKKV